MHTFVMIKDSQGGRFIDLFESLFLVGDPATEPAAAMSIGCENIVARRGSRHCASEHPPGPFEMVLHSGIEF
jgi:hypothetical protein